MAKECSICHHKIGRLEDNGVISDGDHKEINVPEEEFLENQYLQDYYEEDEKYLERPEAQQFYKDYLDLQR